MLKWWEVILAWAAVGFLGMVAATIWGAFIVVVGVLFGAGLKLMGVI